MTITITSVYLGWGFDLHVLAGQTSRAIDGFVVVEANDSGTAKTFTGDALPSGLSLQFFGEFAGAPGPAHGVTLSSTTGRVTVAATLPTPRLYNFLIRAEVSDASGVFAATPRIRMHVHQSLAGNQAWITPASLTVHLGSNGQRFGILAEFDDGTVGDITLLPGISWSSNDTSRVTLGSNGEINPVRDGASVNVTATLPTAWGGLVLSAGVTVLSAWSTPIAATLIAGPGASALATAPNVLFIPDGFGSTTAAKDAFEQLAQGMVDLLRKDARTSPYDLLKNSVNYWMAWIESPEEGCSVLYEAYPVTIDGKLRVLPVPLAAAPPATSTSWSLAELVNEVGLPVSADAIPAGTSATGVTALYNAKLADWISLYGSKVSGRVAQGTYVQWCDLADRRLLDERDTGLGVALGGRPSHERPVRDGLAFLSFFRTSRAHLDGMLAALTNGAGGATIGATWGAASGKDRGLVFALLGHTRGAGAKRELIASTVISKDDEPYVAAGPGRSMTVVPHALPAKPVPGAVFTVAHETAHGVGLADEYGATRRLPAGTSVTALNVQDEGSLLKATGGLDGTKLKWLWPRIQKSSVLTATPVRNSGGDFTLQIKQPKKKYRFKVGDLIQIRRPVSSLPVVPSDLLVVTAVGTGTLTVIAVAFPVTSSPVGYGAGSVVYAPIFATTASGSSVQLMLVATAIRDHIKTTGLPLNAAAPTPGGPAWTCGSRRDDRSYQPAKNLPANLLASRPPELPKALRKARGRIVGAYEGGMDYQCGVYHPSGSCMMRKNTAWDDSAASLFCPVCRYVLVDLLDPMQHGALEAWIATRSVIE